MGEHAIARIARLRPFGIDRQRMQGKWLGGVDHGQRTEDFMDSPQQIGVSTTRAGIRAALPYWRRDRRQVL